MFFDVRFDRQEVLVDEGRDFIVRVGFGLQPNARASSRGRAEVEEQRLPGGLRLGQCRVNVLLPFHSHFLSLLRTYSIPRD